MRVGPSVTGVNRYLAELAIRNPYPSDAWGFYWRHLQRAAAENWNRDR